MGTSQPTDTSRRRHRGRAAGPLVHVGVGQMPTKHKACGSISDQCKQRTSGTIVTDLTTDAENALLAFDRFSTPTLTPSVRDELWNRGLIRYEKRYEWKTPPHGASWEQIVLTASGSSKAATIRTKRAQ